MAEPQSQPGVSPFIPEFWGSQLMTEFKGINVFSQPGVINRDYEGTFSQMGDTLHTSRIGRPTVRKYNASEDMITEDVELTSSEFKIDQGDYFNFRVEDVSKHQAAGNYRDPAIIEAAEEMADTVDGYVGKLMQNGAATANKLGTAEIAKRGDDAYDLVVELRAKLNSNHVPHQGRFLIVGPKLEAALLRDKSFTQVAASGSDQALRNGIIGRILGFDVLTAPNVPTIAGREVNIAGHSSATTFAMQINKIASASELPKRFAEVVAGLQIYGGKVFRPNALATAEVVIKDPVTDPAPAG